MIKREIKGSKEQGTGKAMSTILTGKNDYELIDEPNV
jgi:hypothetical protein